MPSLPIWKEKHLPLSPSLSFSLPLSLSIYIYIYILRWTATAGRHFGGRIKLRVCSQCWGNWLFPWASAVPKRRHACKNIDCKQIPLGEPFMARIWQLGGQTQNEPKILCEHYANIMRSLGLVGFDASLMVCWCHRNACQAPRCSHGVEQAPRVSNALMVPWCHSNACKAPPTRRTFR